MADGAECLSDRARCAQPGDRASTSWWWLLAEGNGNAEERRELRAAVAALPDRQRSVLFLRHYADLGYEQIAEVLGIARGTVAATLSQAHASLRQTIEVPR